MSAYLDKLDQRKLARALAVVLIVGLPVATYVGYRLHAQAPSLPRHDSAAANVEAVKERATLAGAAAYLIVDDPIMVSPSDAIVIMKDAAGKACKVQMGKLLVPGTTDGVWLANSIDCGHRA